ncbi:rRNA adenine N-6-methyltransferase family protein [Microlunatus speluncae]|uniref:rRNA adenine N-6-methyltransferase family protein n=1 Tax=Microlunatus speluncae TaxID=2594267 RepID=UPI00126630A4|nr:rRNA adenine N-6-methyltransferase family protein [Microlunatus speluncae]
MAGAGRFDRASRSGPGTRAAARPLWGWHRLAPDWAGRLVDRAEVRPGQLVVDLGAGTGALTAPLLDAGAEVIAVELHPGRAERLRRRFGTDRLRVLELDARELWLPGRPFRVVSNPPYGITASLVSLITQRSSRLIRADLLLRRGVVNRYLTRPPRRYLAARGMTMPRHAFTPPPPVDSAVLTLRRG